MGDHFDALEADFQHYYGIDLADALYGERSISTRRVVNLVRWLPPEAAVWRALEQSWSTGEELQALTIELLDSIRRLYIQANTKKGTKLPEPIEIRRPWTPKNATRKSGTTLREMIGTMKLPVHPVKGDG